MKYPCFILVLLLCVCAVSTACAERGTITITEETTETLVVENNNVVVVKVGDGGISADSSRVNISNFYPGARAEVIYVIKNMSSNQITPNINLNLDVNTADYDVAKGYATAPIDTLAWFDIPELGIIQPGNSAYYVVAIELPKEAIDIPEKFAFITECAGNNGGRVQTAVGLWWLIDMR